MLETPEEVMGRVHEMTDAIWLASALVSLLERGIAGPFAPDDPAARVAAAFGFLQSGPTGLTAAPAVLDQVGGRGRAFANGMRSTLGQAAAAAFSEGGSRGWSGFNDDVLLAQGRASAAGGPLLAALVVPALDGLAERFARGGRFLDVGVGVAEMACAFCQADPAVSVVGIDVLPRAIDLAAKTVAERGLSDRIELRCQGVEALEDEEQFDLAWLPLPFIPEAAVREGIGRLHRALAPGGWLLVAGSAYEPGAAGEIARWQAHLAGGSLLTPAERSELLRNAGFEPPREVPGPPGLLSLLAARRP